MGIPCKIAITRNLPAIHHFDKGVDFDREAERFTEALESAAGDPTGTKGAYGPGAEIATRQQGFTNIQVSSDNLLVSGEAPVSTVQNAFHTSMVNVRTKNGRIAFANSTSVRRA